MFSKTYYLHGIMTVEMDTFSAWLVQELDKRGWNQAELHRKSSLSKTVISDVIAEKALPGFEFCIGVAKAFKIPADLVMRLAGLLPATSELTSQKEQLIHLFDQLPPDEKEDLISYLQIKLTLLERSGKLNTSSK